MNPNDLAKQLGITIGDVAADAALARINERLAPAAETEAESPDLRALVLGVIGDEQLSAQDICNDLADDGVVASGQEIGAVIAALVGDGVLVQTGRRDGQMNRFSRPDAAQKPTRKAAEAAKKAPVVHRDTAPEDKGPSRPRTRAEKRKRATPAEQDELERRVLSAVELLALDDVNVSVSAIAGRIQGVPKEALANALGKLVKAGKLTKAGEKRNTVYGAVRDIAPKGMHIDSLGKEAAE